MPCYYFNVWSGPNFTPDDEGREFSSLDAAEYEAVRTATDIARDEFPNGVSREVVVEVRDKLGQQVLTVKVSRETNRTASSSNPPRA